MVAVKESTFMELATFARAYHPGLSQLPRETLLGMLWKYRESTLVYREESQIIYFAVYQVWPNHLNFIAIGGVWNYFKIMWHILHNKYMLPAKPFGFYDELRMEGRILCPYSVQ